MNSVREEDPEAVARHHLLIRQCVERSLDEVEQMRRGVPQLVRGDPATWQEVRFCAQRMSATAKQLGLGVLAACAGELARISDEKFAGAALDENFLLTTTTAIETVALELHQLSMSDLAKRR